MRVLYRGTKHNDILVRIDKLETEMNIMKKYDKYIIFLLEQVYADLDFEKRDKNKSKNLIELKKEFQKISKKRTIVYSIFSFSLMLLELKYIYGIVFLEYINIQEE